MTWREALAELERRWPERWGPPGERGSEKATKPTSPEEVEEEIRLVKVFHDAGEDDWKAAATFLERRFPDRWGPPEHRGEA